MIDAELPATVSLAFDGDVAVIRFDDGKANVLTHEAIDGLAHAIRRGSTEAKAIALLGRPGRFCAGFHLPTMAESPASARHLLDKGAQLGLQVYEAPVPVVIGCTGHALAMGAILLMCADLRFGVEGAYKIGLNEVAIGMPMPEFVIAWARDRLHPTKRHTSIQLATLTDAVGAVEAGFLDRATTEDELEATTIAATAELAATLRRTAFRITRERLRNETATVVRRVLVSDLETFRVEG